MNSIYALGVTLAACISQAAMAADHVKDIQADKLRYLKDRFSTEAANKADLETITKADSGSVNFSKLVFTIVPHFTKWQGAAPPPDYKVTLTEISIGGPFVDSLDEVSSNGFPTTQTFSLTYRGPLFLATQSVALSARDAPQSSVIKHLKAFTPLAVSDAGTGEFEWVYQMAPHIQIMNFKDSYFHCTYGTAYPAGKIQAKLKGNAQDLECESRNDSNVATGHATVAMLEYYGISLTRTKMTATSTIEFNVEDVQVD
jgi:hypothetical protein